VRTLLVELSKLSTDLPESLFISGVDIVKTQNTFGGTFGDIYCSKYQGKHVALKRLRMFQTSNRGKIYKVCIILWALVTLIKSMLQKFCAEALLWHRLRHKFILPFLGVDAENFPRQPCMVSPWMAHGTVMQFLQRNPKANIDKLVRVFHQGRRVLSPYHQLYEIAQGIAYLHAERVVHGDIKGVGILQIIEYKHRNMSQANILIDENWHPQLADFGLTLFAENSHYNTTDQGGTMRYMAPELIHPDHFGMTYRRTYASDIYAYACLCIEVNISWSCFSISRRSRC
jgi:serine/threonine protein kinase